MSHGDYDARLMDADSWHGVWRAVSPGLFWRTGGALPAILRRRGWSDRRKACGISQGLPDCDDRARLACCANWRICDLSVVSGGSSSGISRPGCISAAIAAFKSSDKWMAFDRDGVERACC